MGHTRSTQCQWRKCPRSLQHQPQTTVSPSMVRDGDFRTSSLLTTQLMEWHGYLERYRPGSWPKPPTMSCHSMIRGVCPRPRCDCRRIAIGLLRPSACGTCFWWIVWEACGAVGSNAVGQLAQVLYHACQMTDLEAPCSELELGRIKGPWEQFGSKIIQVKTCQEKKTTPHRQTTAGHTFSLLSYGPWRGLLVRISRERPAGSRRGR